MNENNDRFSFAPARCDFDGDGWPDLMWRTISGRDNLYRNREGHFRDEAAKAAADGAGSGMSAAWFDYDGDGRPGPHVSDMWTAPGQRVIRDPAFKPGDEPTRSSATRRATVSIATRATARLKRRVHKKRVEMGRWAWSSGGFDWDLDGVPEILISRRHGDEWYPGYDLDSFFWRQVVAKTRPEQQRRGGRLRERLERAQPTHPRRL